MVGFALFTIWPDVGSLDPRTPASGGLDNRGTCPADCLVGLQNFLCFPIGLEGGISGQVRPDH